MKALILLLATLPQFSLANCPYPFENMGKKYCLDIQWESAELKNKGLFEPTNKMSPYQISMGAIPQKWVYSQAHFHIWAQGDKNHTPVHLPQLRVFPYMHMTNGHHHSTSYDFFYAQEEELYVLRRVALRQMSGCWSLRWTTHTEDSKSDSDFLLNITNYSNIKELGVENQEQLCQKFEEDSDSNDDHGNGHHHHSH